MKLLRTVLVAGLLAAGLHSASRADVIEYNLAGNAAFDEWTNASILASANPGYPTFGDPSAWPGPIGSALGGDATLNKSANSAGGGGPYPGGFSIYFGSFSSGINGGALTVTDSTPVANLSNVVFQVELAGSFFSGNPSLQLTTTGGSQTLSANRFGIIQSEPLPDFMGQPNFSNTYSFQWDLSSIQDTITGFSISFDAFAHSQVYELRVDQSDTFNAVAVPEPASMAVLGLAAGCGIYRKVRRRKAAKAPQA